MMTNWKLIALALSLALLGAVASAFREARPLPGNEFKIVLAQRAAVRAVQEAAT